MVYFLALLAAFIFAVSSILQRLGVETAPDDARLSGRLITHMFKRRVWISGFVLMGVGFLAQAMALHIGTLAEVQPALVSEMVFIVVALWLWYSMELRVRDALWSLAATGGLAAFLAASNPLEGSHVPSLRLWLLVAAAIVLTIGVLIGASLRGPDFWRALSLGAAGAMGFAFTAALTKSVTDLLARGWSPLFTSWQTYALVVFGLSSFFIMQSAFHVGPFAASQSTLILVNPFVSIIIGHVLFGDHLRGGATALGLETLSLFVMVLGAVGLARSPLIAGVHDETPGSQLLANKGQWARWRQRRSSTRAH